MSEKTAKEEYKEAWSNIRHDMRLAACDQDWVGFWHYHDAVIAKAAWQSYYGKTRKFDGWSKPWRRERFIRLRNQYLVNQVWPQHENEAGHE